MSAAALGMLMFATHSMPAASADSADALPGDGPLYGNLREGRGGASVPVQRTHSFDEIRRRTHDSGRVFFAGEATQSAGATARMHREARALDAQYRPAAESVPGLGAPVGASPSDLLARLHYAFGSDVGLSSARIRQEEGEVLLRNSDAFLRAKVRLTLGKKWLGFVYADVGAADSALRWQGLADIRGGHGVDLLGGWRHVTYHFSPGKGLDSLEFNGPFLGASLAW